MKFLSDGTRIIFKKIGLNLYIFKDDLHLIEAYCIVCISSQTNSCAYRNKL